MSPWGADVAPNHFSQGSSRLRDGAGDPIDALLVLPVLCDSFYNVLRTLTQLQFSRCELPVASGDAGWLPMVAIQDNRLDGIQVHFRCLSISLNSGAPEERSNS